MPVNTASIGSADVANYIQKATLPLVRRRLVVYQFGDPLTLPKGYGTTYQAARWNRVPLPFGPLSEGVPPIGQTMSVTMVSATVQQWGDKITLTDIAEMTIFHPMFQIAKELCTLAVSETLERNTFNNLLAGTQINYVNSKGARGSLATGDVLNIHEFNRANVMLQTLGAPRFDGDEQTNQKIDAASGGSRASSDPSGHPHYVAVISTLTEGDLIENSTFVLASSYSDVNKLYNAEIGRFSNIRFCSSNMVPTWTGYAQVNGTAGTAGNLAGGTYYIQMTGSDTQNQYESYICAVSTSATVTGPNGSISVTTPNVAGFSWNVYISTTTSPTNLGLCASGPTAGPMLGQATQLPGNTTVTITGVGAAQVPPAIPTAGVTVYPSFIFGRGAYGQVKLDDIKYAYLDKADKSDPNNQLRVVSWKVMYGTILLNTQFYMRIESTSAFSTTFG